MFICQRCGSVVGPGIAQIKKVLRTRHKVYTERVTNDRGYTSVQKVGQGHETVKEISVGPCCDEANKRQEAAA
jgi:hypothetical protein